MATNNEYYYTKYVCKKCNQVFNQEQVCIEHAKCCLIEDNIKGQKIHSIKLKNDKLTIFLENEHEIKINVKQNRLLDIKVEESLPF